MSKHPLVSWSLTLAVVVCAHACRNSSGNSNTTSEAVVPNTAGSNGCLGPDQTFSTGQIPTTIALTTLVAGPSSQIAAARNAELLYATGANGQVVAIDVSTATAVETEIVPVGTIATLLDDNGVAGTPLLSGVAVLDAQTLVVVERTSNTLIEVALGAPSTVAFLAGQPSSTPGFANGIATGGGGGLARFSFTASTQVCPTGDGRIFVADAGNHAIRIVESGVVITLCGNGAAGFEDGDLASTLLDTPIGVCVACNGALLATEAGLSGFGQRVRLFAIGAPSPFGGFFGSSSTLTGSGLDVTSGGPQATAEVARPASPVTTAGGDVYWVDTTTGVLRRFRSGEVDCPLGVDCDAAVMTPTFPAGHSISLALTAGGVLYALDADAGILARITP